MVRCFGQRASAAAVVQRASVAAVAQWASVAFAAAQRAPVAAVGGHQTPMGSQMLPAC